MSLVRGEVEMSPATLRSISTERTCDLLMRGDGRMCSENPFSSMPASVVNGLFACMLHRDQVERSRLLVASGRLERVDLYRTWHFMDYVPLLRMLSHSSQNLRALLLPCCRYLDADDAEHLLHALLFQCPNLEELHSNIPFNPRALFNCSKLRRLELHFDSRRAIEFVSYFAIEPLLLGSLEVLSLHHPVDPELRDGCLLASTAIVLDESPRLTSMGYLDSSMALKRLHDRDSNGPGRRFQLRKCLWQAGDESSDFGYCERIRVAAQACPLLNALELEVRDARCLRHLKSLAQLTSLSVHFEYSEKENELELYSLLEDMGPQLRHLCVYDFQEDPERPLHLNRMCSSCPNLRILQLHCALTADEATVDEACADLPHLERLSVYSSCDRQTLSTLLTGCLRLVVLCLRDTELLDDDLLQSVLRRNPFEELEVAHIGYTSLSESGVGRLVRSARKLRKFCFESDDEEAAVRLVGVLNPSVDCPYEFDFSEIEEEHFPDLIFG